MSKDKYQKDFKLKKFSECALKIEKEYSCVIQFAEIFGSRWAYSAGNFPDKIFNPFPNKIKINGKIGLIIYYKEELAENILKEIKEKMINS